MKKNAIIDFFGTQSVEILNNIYERKCENLSQAKASSYTLQELAEYLCDWGDSGISFNGNLNTFLFPKFCEYAHGIVEDRYTLDEVTALVDNAQSVDLLMDDWDDIVQEIFEDVVGFCPYCGTTIYKDNKHYYVMESDKMLYECEYCETEVQL